MEIKNKLFKVIKDIIVFAILAFVLYVAYQFFQANNFIGYTKAVQKSGITEFKRDNKERYSENRSFKISSNDFNDVKTNHIK